MLVLSNGARVHAAYVIPGGNGMKPNGICLAETPTDWVVWNIYWDGIHSNPNIGCHGHDLWEAENGDYFHKQMDTSRAQAEFIFGRRLLRFIPDSTWNGMKEYHAD